MSPTWREGWDAHAAGWPLYSGHTKAYREGWLARCNHPKRRRSKMAKSDDLMDKEADRNELDRLLAKPEAKIMMAALGGQHDPDIFKEFCFWLYSSGYNAGRGVAALAIISRMLESDDRRK